MAKFTVDLRNTPEEAKKPKEGPRESPHALDLNQMKPPAPEVKTAPPKPQIVPQQTQVRSSRIPQTPVARPSPNALNLKPKKEPTREIVSKKEIPPSASAPDASSPPATASDTSVPYTWSTPEYQKTSGGAERFLVPGGIALLLAVVSIVTGNISFLIVVVLAFAVIMMYMLRSPRNITCSITPEGILIGNKLHSYHEIKSFWIRDYVEPKELSLKTGKTLTPYMTIPLGESDPKEIRTILAQFLSEEKHEDLMIDTISRRLGF